MIGVIVAGAAVALLGFFLIILPLGKMAVSYLRSLRRMKALPRNPLNQVFVGTDDEAIDPKTEQAWALFYTESDKHDQRMIEGHRATYQSSQRFINPKDTAR